MQVKSSQESTSALLDPLGGQQEALPIAPTRQLTSIMMLQVHESPHILTIAYSLLVTTSSRPIPSRSNQCVARSCPLTRPGRHQAVDAFPTVNPVLKPSRTPDPDPRRSSQQNTEWSYERCSFSYTPWRHSEYFDLQLSTAQHDSWNTSCYAVSPPFL
jgi:hypothetical protein